MRLILTALMIVTVFMGITLSPVKSDAQIPNLGGLGGGCFPKDITSPTKSHKGNGRELDGTKDHDEKPDCPDVDCNNDSDFTKRVEGYFNYKPPRNNREALTRQAKQEVNVPGAPENKNGNAFNMGDIDCEAGSLRDISEPCQDNRWRDTCLVGFAGGDWDYAAYGRPLMPDEEPFAGKRGSVPPIDLNNKQQINCTVPKNTEVTSPLLFDNGWRFRFMCPGDDSLARIPGEQYTAKMDLFSGVNNCDAPKPTCTLDSDWLLDSTNWRNANHGAILDLFRFGEDDGVRTLQKVRDYINNPSVWQVLLNRMKADSRAAECKPAFWTRLMMDNCANQYIAQTSAKPPLSFNPDMSKAGNSPRMCQPFAAVKVTAGNPHDVEGGEEEYSPRDYLKAAAKGVLKNDYMPWVDYGNPWKGSDANSIYERWKRKQPQRTIKGLDSFQNDKIDRLFDQMGDASINDYAAQNVERIVDVSHPYSPRYDIAMFSNLEKIDDRNLFKGATETKMRPAVLLLGKCVPSSKTGYFEYGNCTIYCSAVKVDVLRFRYEDYRLCMGCQIDANQYAFWEEVDENEDYYKKENCRSETVSNEDKEWKESDDDHCNYGDDYCGACSPSEKAKIAANAILCAYGDADACKEMAEDIYECMRCNKNAEYEAVERARKRINHELEPEYGPSATKEDGKSWPICSTRYDYEGDIELCKTAKEDSGDCEGQGEQGDDDENIGEDRTTEAKECVDKDIHDICESVAKPVVGLNFLKLRTRKAGVATEDKDWNFVRSMRNDLKDNDPPEAYHFRKYFGNRRPYMRWWDTGKESFQSNDADSKPDYACDFGANDTYIGVGRDYNSIHGRKLQICGYGGGAGIGGNCFDISKWAAQYPSLAGSEWAELKMYQANCYRNEGLNCLCQYEKVFTQQSTEQRVLEAYRGAVTIIEDSTLENPNDPNNPTRLEKTPKIYEWPLGWRGYVSTPQKYETATTSPAIDPHQQFPYLYGELGNSMSIKGLDSALVGDVIIWPAGSSKLPHVSLVIETHNAIAYTDTKDAQDTLENGRKRLPEFLDTEEPVPAGYRGYVIVVDANNGKLPDACGNTNMLGFGAPRRIYAQAEDMPKQIRDSYKDQVFASYYCEDSNTGTCALRAGEWNNAILYRPNQAPLRIK